MQSPPLAPEDWLAFVMAAQAHRSSNVSHSSFGNTLIKRYFEEVPKRFADDETAALYFDAILCHVASAVRGFAVIRQIFATEVSALHAVRDTGAEAIRRIQGFGPLTPDNPWKAIVPGVAGAIVTYFVATDEFRKSTLVAGALAFAVILAFLILGQAVVEVIVHLKAKSIHGKAPDEVLATWRTKTAEHYATVSVQLLADAYAVTNRYYPASATVPSREELRKTAEAHLELLFAK